MQQVVLTHLVIHKPVYSRVVQLVETRRRGLTTRLLISAASQQQPTRRISEESAARRVCDLPPGLRHQLAYPEHADAIALVLRLAVALCFYLNACCWRAPELEPSSWLHCPERAAPRSLAGRTMRAQAAARITASVTVKAAALQHALLRAASRPASAAASISGALSASCDAKHNRARLLQLSRLTRRCSQLRSNAHRSPWARDAGLLSQRYAGILIRCRTSCLKLLSTATGERLHLRLHHLLAACLKLLFA